MHLNNTLRTIACLAIATFLSNAIALPTNASTTHCLTTERVQFSCRIGVKVVSLCTGGTVENFSSLSYRYGLIGKVENEFTALPNNGKRFYTTVMPANPRAAVKQIWFNRGKTRYLLTECAGGNCPQESGLAILKGNQILMNRKCEYEPDVNLGWFSSELVSFNLGETWNVQSSTSLLKVTEEDNDLEKLFPSRPGFW